MTVTEALKARVSIRAFKPDPVPETLVREILDIARWAPSGGNLQPWKVVAVAGAERDAVCARAKQALLSGVAEEGEYPPYPANLWEPYRTRRFKNGEDMYALLDIPREDRAKRLQHFSRNYDLFDAPVGLFFVIDRRMGYAQWSHLGMFMHSVALAAVERGLSSCMQEAWARVRETLAKHFALPVEEMIVCGMALGYADETKPVNCLRSDRAEVDEFTTFRGF
jgi:nitroreductase